MPEPHQPKGHEPHQPKGPESHQPKGPETHQPKGPEPHQPKGPELHQPKGPKPHQPKGPKPHQPKGLSPTKLRGLSPINLRGLSPTNLRDLSPTSLRGSGSGSVFERSEAVNRCVRTQTSALSVKRSYCFCKRRASVISCTVAAISQKPSNYWTIYNFLWLIYHNFRLFSLFYDNYNILLRWSFTFWSSSWP